MRSLPSSRLAAGGGGIPRHSIAPIGSSAIGRERYDVVIAGASFAGLAVVRGVRGRVLLIDRQPVGDGVTSACAAPVWIVQMMGAGASIQQVHNTLVIHTPGGRTEWPLPEPFCTFDYRRFCLEATALAGSGVEFLQASVQGRDGHGVLTTVGAVRGRILVDATGPRAALAGLAKRRHVAFGLESEIDAPVDPGLHFYFVPEIRDGYAWAFPCGDRTRFGVLSYRGRTRLRPALERFMARFGHHPEGMHGGYLATGWTAGRADLAGDVFVIGDAAGHCLPISGEGIRTAVLAGARCGSLLQAVLDGVMTLGDAQRAYQRFVAEDRRRYRALLWGNLALLGLPQGWLGPAAGLLARPRVHRWLFKHYLGIFGPQSIAALPNTRQSHRLRDA